MPHTVTARRPPFGLTRIHFCTKHAVKMRLTDLRQVDVRKAPFAEKQRLCFISTSFDHDAPLARAATRKSQGKWFYPHVSKRPLNHQVLYFASPQPPLPKVEVNNVH
jgi:hypothetical protein